MINKNLPALLVSLFLFSLQVEAQSGGAIAVSPPLTCGLTTYACPGITNGCCKIGACCGTGCCPIGYKCINEGTSDQACCSYRDPTACGTMSSPSPDAGSGGGGSGGVDKSCTQIHNCRDSSTGQTWACFLGQPCALHYRGCFSCPYAEESGGGGGGGGGDDASSSTDSPSDTSTSSTTETPTETPTSTATGTATGTSTGTGTGTGAGAGAAVTSTKAPSMGIRPGGDGIGNVWVLFLVWVVGYLYVLA